MRKAVAVVSKRGCHLCDKVIEALDSLSSRYEFDVRVLDIQQDPKLHDEYWLRIPVVQIGGKDVFEAKDMVDTADCTRFLELLVSKS
jgi:glutaredoxin